jgi:hypothetical protein
MNLINRLRKFLFGSTVTVTFQTEDGPMRSVTHGIRTITYRRAQVWCGPDLKKDDTFMELYGLFWKIKAIHHMTNVISIHSTP